MKRAASLLAIISGKGKPKGKSEDEEMDDDMEDDGDGEDYSTAQDVLDAIKDGDAESLHLALKKHYEECMEG